MSNYVKDVKPEESDVRKRTLRKPFFSFHEDPSINSYFFEKSRDTSAVHTDGPPVPQQNAPQQTPVTPCPTSVSIGSLTPFNHGNLPAAEKEKWGTYLEVTSKMDVGPGPDHTGHCMKERLTTVSNNCPAQVYSRGGGTESQPCVGNRCLDINRFGSGPTAFIDMHRTRHPSSLLAGTGMNECSVICEQIYLCDRTGATTGKFRITRNFKADSITKQDGTSMHITTGEVLKEMVQPGVVPHGPLGDFEVTEEIKHTA
jgi:hypothetical protein